MKSKSEIAKIIKRQRNLAKRSLSSQYENTLNCHAFYNGDSMSYRSAVQFLNAGGQRQKALVNFNKVQEPVDAVCGFMAQNRRQAKFFARVNSEELQQLYSKKMNAVYEYHRENENADQIESDQDLNMLINGYGATDTEVSYMYGQSTNMPNGTINKINLDPECLYWDPTARAKNLIDARFCGYWRDYDLREALDLFQGSKEDDFQTVDQDTGAPDTGYQFNPWGGLYDKIKMNDGVDWVSKEEEMVRVYNHQWFEYETFYKAENPIYKATSVDEALFYKASLDTIFAEQKNYGPDDIEVSDPFAFDPTAPELTFDEKTKRKLVADFGDLIDPVPFTRQCYYTAVCSGDHVFKCFKSISQCGFSIKFKTGTFSKTSGIWTGMVNTMMEPAQYHNKALTELMFTIAANSKGGVIIEEDAIEDITDFEKKWAKTDGVIVVRSGAIAAGKFMEKAKAALPTGLEGVIQLTAQAITSAGVDPAFFGEAANQESGVLYKRRIRQVISKMAKYFDSNTLYQKEDARLHADLIPVWAENNQGAVMRISGKDGAQEFLQLTKDVFYPEYDITIQEAPATPEDKQETAQLLGGMADKYLSIGAIQQASALHVLALQNLPLDGDDKNRAIEALQPQESVPLAQYKQLEQQLQLLQSQMTQVEVQKKQSETQLNMAKTQQISGDIHLKAASTVETLEKAENITADTKKKLAETQAIMSAPRETAIV
jgi:hypothetical protein